LHNFLIIIKNNTIHCFLKKYWSKSDLRILDSFIPKIYLIKWAIIWLRISLSTDEHIYNTNNLYIDIIWIKIKLGIAHQWEWQQILIFLQIILTNDQNKIKKLSHKSINKNLEWRSFKKRTLLWFSFSNIYL
jgi:hypothetical protein